MCLVYIIIAFVPNCDESLSLLYYDKTGATGPQQAIVL